jgi:protein-tyrosine phosphatase
VNPTPYNAREHSWYVFKEWRVATHSKIVDEHKPTEEAFRKLLEPGVTLKERVGKNIKVAGQKLLPKAVLQEVRRYRTYAGVERSLYLKIRVLNGIGLMDPKSSRPPRTARSFVFVCFGNIMRSPMCEALLNRALAAVPNKQIRVASAGLNAAPGRAAHPWAVAAARDLGISLESHRAKLLTAEMVNQADVIFAMDYQNQVQLLSRYAQANGKVFMLGAYAGENYRPLEINDPYYSGEEGTRDCYKVLNTCIRNLVSSLLGE